MNYLGIQTSEGIKIDNSKEVSVETIEFLDQWRKVVEDFDNINSLFQLLVSEVSAFNKYMVECSQKTIEDLNADEWFNTTLNKHVINIASNGRLFYEYLSLIIEKEYSEYEEEWEKQVSQIFDNNFSYRFFNKFRNYIQHIGFPITELKMKYEDENGKDKLIVEIQFKASVLLKKSKEWGKHIKPDLIELGDGNIIFSEIMWDYFHNLNQIYFNSLEVFMKKNYKFITKKYVKLIELCRKELGGICVFDISESQLLKLNDGKFDELTGRPITSLKNVNRVVNTLHEVGIIKKILL